MDWYVHPYPVGLLNFLKNALFFLIHTNQVIRLVTDSILAKAKISPPVVLTLKNYETAQSLAGQGMGVTFLPGDYANITSTGCPPALFSIDEKYSPGWDLCITTLRNGFLSRADQYFLSMMRKALAG